MNHVQVDTVLCYNHLLFKTTLRSCVIHVCYSILGEQVGVGKKVGVCKQVGVDVCEQVGVGNIGQLRASAAFPARQKVSRSDHKRRRYG